MYSRVNRTTASRGFSLIELTIVVLVVGLLLVPLVQLYDGYMKQQKIETTQENLDRLRGFISSVHDSFTPVHYPCPSDRALQPGSPEYGKEFNGGNCTLASLKALKGLDYATVTATNPACTADFGFCLVQGARDADGDTKPDPVVIGGVPVFGGDPVEYLFQKVAERENEQPLARNVLRDGWNGSFAYAVSLNLVNNEGTNKNANGVIAVEDENGNPTAGINKDAHYVLISHGPDSKGAYTQFGKLTIACGTTATAKDSENCDNDSLFVSAIGFFQANTTKYYDDTIYAGKLKDAGLWENIYRNSLPTDPVTGDPIKDPVTGLPLGLNTGHIHNLNEQYIGIKTANPSAKLDVNGTIRGDRNIKGGKICDSSGVKCFDIKAITADDDLIKCADGKAMNGITKGIAGPCVTPAFATTITPISCPPGQYIRGIKTDGSPKCDNP